MIKKVLLVFAFFSFIFGFSQEIPNLKVENAEKEITLEKLVVKTEVIGNIATTTYEMQFFNPNQRVLEGELNFPLGENQNVIRFALDINGNLREAVVVKKEKARVAFESTVKRKIDPALLEKVEGNNYKARVYPIPANGYKKVVLVFEEELPLHKLQHELKYSFDFTKKLEEFSLSIIAFEQKEASISTNGFLKRKSFEKDGNNLLLNFKKKNFQPKESIEICFELEDSREKLITFEEYFYFYKLLNPEKRKREQPKNIDLFWDSSLSMKERNLEKELSVLGEYFRKNPNLHISLVNFSNRIKEEKHFKIKNGNWETLKMYLENTIYDGATSYKAIQKKLKQSEYTFLFTDGMKNFGSFTKSFKNPIFIFNSVAKSNHFYLKEICLNSGGNYLNLNRISNIQAQDILENETFSFIGFEKETDSNLEIYPKVRTAVTNDFSIVGKDYMIDEVVELHFGFGNEITQKVRVVLKESEKESARIPKFWATKKIAFLSKNKKENEEEIISVSKEYQVISDFTSMIVLDRVEDYVEHEIVPPKDLQERYFNLLQEKSRREKQFIVDTEAPKRELLRDFHDFVAWNKKDYYRDQRQKYIQDSLSKRKKFIQDSINQLKILKKGYLKINGTVSDEEGPLMGAVVISKNENTSVLTDFDGKFEILVKKGDVLEFSFIGFKTKKVKIRNSFNFAIILKGDSSNLEEIQVVGYQKRKRNNSNNEVELIEVVENDEIIEEIVEVEEEEEMRVESENDYFSSPEPEAESDVEAYRMISDKTSNVANALEGKASGVVISNNNIEENNKEEKSTVLKSWDSKAIYVKDLKKIKLTKVAYQKYLELRPKYQNMPTFYFDVADFFIYRKAPKIALQIISNVAEMDVDNYELLRALAYKLEATNHFEEAVFVYQKIIELRPEDIQSYRDLALAYEEIGEYQKAIELLYKIVNGSLLEKDSRRNYLGIEEISFIEMNHIISKYPKKITIDFIEKEYIKDVSMDFRVVIDWNHNDTDIDLWVTDANNEKCYYGHKKTKIYGRISDDMTRGFGPENFTLKKIKKGKYLGQIKYYGDTKQKISGPTILKTTVYQNYGKKDESKEIKVFRLDKRQDILTFYEKVM
ncbi:VIT domain-containing protein [Aureivirga marina]|uniref:VIT domain-containing protein n=1 Tax=Aureivirga marina TaxID=1182451 RepID=UPI0018C96F15|nr:VIT domain-containing protein [Aureivirga marina]